MPFNLDEAKAMIAIAANLEGPTPPLPMPAIPANWGSKPIFDSPVMGEYDNKWQLWGSAGTNQYAVVIRGTVGKIGSIWEDLMAVMIPASGTLPVDSMGFPYKLAADPKAAVHYGFTLGMGILMFDDQNGILTQLKQHVLPGAEVFIVGHSQGAAIATLCRSYMAYDPVLSTKYQYKTYLYAQPKPGNDHYGLDFERLCSNTPTGFCVTNNQDWVPQVPLTLQGLARLNTPNPLGAITEGKILAWLGSLFKKLLMWHVKRKCQKKHAAQLQSLARTLKNQKHITATSNVSPLDMEIVPTLNFVNCGVPIALAGTPGGNPNDPNDFFWQHHAPMYYKLLCTVFP